MELFDVFYCFLLFFTVICMFTLFAGNHANG